MLGTVQLQTVAEHGWTIGPHSVVDVVYAGSPLTVILLLGRSGYYHESHGTSGWKKFSTLCAAVCIVNTFRKLSEASDRSRRPAPGAASSLSCSFLHPPLPLPLAGVIESVETPSVSPLSRLSSPLCVWLLSYKLYWIQTFSNRVWGRHFELGWSKASYMCVAIPGHFSHSN